MRKEDLFKKNHILGIEFDRYLLEYPEVLEQIPEDAGIYFLPEEDPELSQENFRTAQTQKAKGKKILLVRIGKLSPHRSRLQDVRLESIPFSTQIFIYSERLKYVDISQTVIANEVKQSHKVLIIKRLPRSPAKAGSLAMTKRDYDTASLG